MLDGLIATRTRAYPALPFGLPGDRVTRVWLMSGVFLLAVLVVLLPAGFVDTRQLDGVSVWAKPLKFSVALALHLVTLAVLAKQLDLRHRAGTTLTVVGYSAVAAALFEQTYISLQAAQGLRSHFNNDTDFHAMMYRLMGVGAVLLVLASFTLGVMIWKHGTKNDTGLRLGSIAGLVLGSVLTLVIAGYMSAQMTHAVGAVAGHAGNVPLFGWSRTNGDLRVPHFVATHTMQILPLIGWGFDKLRWHPRGVVVGAAIALTLLSAALFVLSLTGSPLFPA